MIFFLVIQDKKIKLIKKLRQLLNKGINQELLLNYQMLVNLILIV